MSVKLLMSHDPDGSIDHLLRFDRIFGRRGGKLRGAAPRTSGAKMFRIEGMEQRILLSSVYTITDLGTLGGGSSVANAINATGQVVGYSDKALQTH